ncbi:MAG: tRNA pseudouridine(38-40) synthase TruA [Candidatus Azobacteroides pseudotrichonymphae]|uniref:tRNA pseudouridine synthase A n=1 Tax=Azobacteroides pseudotrichonymphae genomovar. CFP2 TaxID=511995 RepID=TRUA_AZOPC|nr:tRNA pseudouridine(38-40) synthase TruA [Candidatus Azobacteroides pseudotrichonymphae]B6YQE4.1 RecName: Full=tRNA pseudouridine synthase A; AltName: Full=tRNA pseudouridine(38-40) synthase; AltName: Full=tRNA pseudouridylate synthase I; AltName: Full=tRNA-uridine isomerase I [Candidatus Azobacteroides pseudotrichonymphae genomovar. CFP2]MDR0530331.1 tRNA pseudouridine(38-40) synthase TruA [Bacteroidales bacterium OttesenSCG-928-I14]BAG83416.1 tRNA pseudouridine synthase A [Candidatus Azobact
MNRYFIYLAYNGRNYCGWQIQPNGITVQQRIQQCLSILLRKSVTIIGAGRTDAGVHANLMTAHFDWEEILSTTSLTKRLNGILPCDILIYKIIPVKKNAHARFDAISRKYKYYITYQKNPFRNEQLFRLKQPLNKHLMNEASNILSEYSDFTSFCKLHSNTRTNVCRISKAEWNTVQGIDIFTIKADRFLRNMVRSIVGTMIDIGKNKLSITDFRKIIESKNHIMLKSSVPAHALFLTDIEYPNWIFKN